MNVVKVDPPKCEQQRIHEVIAWAEEGRPVECPFCHDWFVSSKPSSPRITLLDLGMFLIGVGLGFVVGLWPW